MANRNREVENFFRVRKSVEKRVRVIRKRLPIRVRKSVEKRVRVIRKRLRLAPVACFSRALRRLHVFPALGTGYVFFSTWYFDIFLHGIISFCLAF